MNSGRQSYWHDTYDVRYLPLEKDTDFDVVIVGGGITGLTAAYLLKQAGQRVGVLDKEIIGLGDTGQTTAHITMVTDAHLHDLVDSFGKEKARLTWEAGVAAIDTIERIVGERNIDCDFRRVPGMLCDPPLAGAPAKDANISRDVDLARELGFEAQWVDVDHPINRPAMLVPNQALFHPLKYIAALATAVHGDGSAVYEKSHFASVERADDGTITASINAHQVTCRKLVIATHVPLMGLGRMTSATLFQTKLAGYSSYVVGARLPTQKVPEMLVCDTADPYYYLRIHHLQDGSAYAILGGKDHKTGQHDAHAENPYVPLQQLMSQLFPDAILDCSWTGQVIETNDGLPYIGPSTDGQFIATGFAGNGMTFGTVAGMMARDWALENDNPWQDLFSVDRKPLRKGAWEYLKENIDFPVYLVKGRMTPADRQSIESLTQGEGRVVSLDGHKCAIARDEEGQLHIRSAICTHMGCVVRWNGMDRTWDCPCHGSRFAMDGCVISGPAETPLAAEATEAQAGSKGK